MLFVTGIISFGIITVVMLLSKSAKFSNNDRRILYGVIFLTSNILVDVASFHPVDQVFKLDFFGCNVRLVFELCIIIWIAISLIIKKNEGQKKPSLLKENSRIRLV